jgi:hypothetical protein
MTEKLRVLWSLGRRINAALSAQGDVALRPTRKQMAHAA